MRGWRRPPRRPEERDPPAPRGFKSRISTGVPRGRFKVGAVGQAGDGRRVDAAALGRLYPDAGCYVHAEGDLRAIAADVDDAAVASHVLDDDPLAGEHLALHQVGE